MKPIRSFLFVPGNRESWLDKVAGADALDLDLDLEDSVPADAKPLARELVARKMEGLAAAGERAYVRINRSPSCTAWRTCWRSPSRAWRGSCCPSRTGPRTSRPSDEIVAYYTGMIEAFDRAQVSGRAAVIYDGEHIDYAHVKTARDIVEQARMFRASS